MIKPFCIRELTSNPLFERAFSNSFFYDRVARPEPLFVKKAGTNITVSEN
jgi:hypothetical protein